ncbi:hypothetical protein MKX01_005077 [Papaver californicum]|nr:hypothetical protein MKX01_005077 [Papaver californicum]
MDVVGKDEEIVLRKSDKKKLKRNKDTETVSTTEVPTEKKKHRKSKEIEAISSSELPTDVGGQKKVKGSGEKEGVKHRKKKEKEKATECSDVECATDQTASKGKDHINVGGEENVVHVKNGKGKKSKRNENGDDFGESCIEKSGGEAQSGSRSSKKRDREEEVLDVAIGEGKKKKKTRTKLDANIENAKASIGDVETENHFRSTDEHLRNSDSKKSSKRVKFASHVEVFPTSDDIDDQEENPGKELIRGKRPWEAVYQRGHTLFTRDELRTWTEDGKTFILKYRQLSSSMVKEGKWDDIDDYRLLNELYMLDACCVEDVEWDNLLEHRPGDISLKRWRQMVNYIDIHGLQSFAEQVEVLAKRYCPELLEVREAVDSRPLVD